jgi:poly(A) polymerase
MAGEILARLRFSKKEIEAAVECIAQHMAFKDVQQMRVSRLKRFLARPTMADELILHRVDCAASNQDFSNHDFLVQKIEEFSKEPLIPPPLITGRDLLEFGFEAGPLFKQILEQVQSRQLEGSLHTRGEALAWVRETHPSCFP